MTLMNRSKSKLMKEKHMGRAEIKITDSRVIRPRKEWSVSVQKFLRFLRDKNVDYVPEPLGFDEDGNEVVSYLPGEVYDYPLPPLLLTTKSIVSAGKLLRDFHDKGADFLNQLNGNEIWMLNYDTPYEVMCHSDFAPYNVTTEDGLAKGIIDFDTLMPGSRMWDLAYGAYRWAPLYFDKTVYISPETSSRLKYFLEAYGLPKSEFSQVIPTLIKRLNYLIEFMERAAESGEKNFQNDIADGHIRKYKNDILCLRENEGKLNYELRIK